MRRGPGPRRIPSAHERSPRRRDRDRALCPRRVRAGSPSPVSVPTTPRTPLVLDEAGRRALQRRCMTVVVISQIFGGAGLAAGVTVGALLAQEMLGGESLAG